MSRFLIAGATRSDWQSLAARAGTEHDLLLLCRKPGDPAPGRTWLPTLVRRAGQIDAALPVDIAFCCLGTTCKDAGSAEAFPAGSISTMCWPLLRSPVSTGCRRLLVVSSLAPTRVPLPSIPAPRARWSRPCWPRSGSGSSSCARPCCSGHREPARRSEQIIQAIYPLVAPAARVVRRWRAIEASQVAHAMARLAIQESGIETVENERLLTLVMPVPGETITRAPRRPCHNPSPVRCRHRLACGATSGRPPVTHIGTPSSWLFPHASCASPWDRR